MILYSNDNETENVSEYSGQVIQPDSLFAYNMLYMSKRQGALVTI